MPRRAQPVERKPARAITLDEWLMSAAIKMGVSQVTLEREFYMIDLPLMLHAKDKAIAEERLTLLRIAHPPTEKREAEEFVRRIGAPLEAEAPNEHDELDREGLARLRRRITGG